MVTQPLQPPVPPERAPWQDIALLTQRIDKLVTVLEAGIAPVIPGVPGVTPMILFPGAPPAQQLILLLSELVPGAVGASAIISFQKTVAVAYQDEQERMVPFSGIIENVIMGFPAGCHQLVEVDLLYLPAGGGRKRIIPTIENTFIALDDFTVLFRPGYPLKAPGNLRVEWWNYDSLNTHNVPVIVTISPTRLGVT